MHEIITHWATLTNKTCIPIFWGALDSNMQSFLKNKNPLLSDQILGGSSTLTPHNLKSENFCFLKRFKKKNKVSITK